MRFLGHLLPRSYSWTFDYVLVGAWCGLYALYDPVDTDVLFTGSGGRGGFICCGGCGDGDECGIEVVNAVSSRVSAVDSAMLSGTVFFRREVVGFSDYSASVLSRAGSGLFSGVDAGFLRVFKNLRIWCLVRFSGVLKSEYSEVLVKFSSEASLQHDCR